MYNKYRCYGVRAPFVIGYVCGFVCGLVFCVLLFSDMEEKPQMDVNLEYTYDNYAHESHQNYDESCFIITIGKERKEYDNYNCKFRRSYTRGSCKTPDKRVYQNME